MNGSANYFLQPSIPTEKHFQSWDLRWWFNPLQIISDWSREKF